MRNLKNYILDIAFPRRCLGCEILMRDESISYVCRSCLGKIKFNGSFACAFCQSPAIQGKTCRFCLKNHFLDRLWVTAFYNDPLVENMLKSLKYRFVKSLAEDMVGLMAKFFEKRLVSNIEINHLSIAIIPVPLSSERLNWRGFNQAEIIGYGLGNYLGLPVDTQNLRRVHNHKPQADITDRRTRIENIKNAFKYCRVNDNEALKVQKTIILIDDVSTTGSTLDECARILKNAGAKEVFGFVFARNKMEQSALAIKS